MQLYVFHHMMLRSQVTNAAYTKLAAVQKYKVELATKIHMKNNIFYPFQYQCRSPK